MKQAARNNKSFPQTWIMDVPFSKLSMGDTVEYLEARIQANEYTQVVTANPEIVMYAQQDPNYLELLQQVEMVVADGIGIVYAAKIQYQPVTERVAGYDLLLELMKQANQHHWGVYLLGAEEEVNRLAFEKLKNSFPNARIVGRHHGFFKDGSELEQQILEDIKEKKPHLLFVALGFPRQENWIAKHQKDIAVPYAMGVGGSFDGLSGKVKRAPIIWQKLGLEWFYRLLSMPSRWRRMLVLPRFMVKQILNRNHR